MIKCVQNVNMPSRIDNVFMFIYTSFLLRYGHFFNLSYCKRMFIFSKTMNKCFFFLKWLAFFSAIDRMKPDLYVNVNVLYQTF